MQNRTYCPECDHEITSREININEGVALCSGCGQLSRLSELIHEEDDEMLGDSLPKSIAIHAGNNRVEIHLSLASLPMFLGSLFVSLFWNGIVSVFLSLAAAAVYYQIWGPVPEWFPTPGLEEGKPVMNDQVMGPSMTIFFCLFLTPFVVIGVSMIINTLMRLFGKTVIVIDPYQSRISTGVGLLKLTRNFNPLHIKAVSIQESRLRNNNQTTELIELTTSNEGGKSVRFGRMFNEEQLVWSSKLLNRIIMRKGSAKLDQYLPQIDWLGHRRKSQ